MEGNLSTVTASTLRSRSRRPLAHGEPGHRAGKSITDQMDESLRPTRRALGVDPSREPGRQPGGLRASEDSSFGAGWATRWRPHLVPRCHHEPGKFEGLGPRLRADDRAVRRAG